MHNGDVTIVYYTSNREDEAFESKIREHLLEAKGDIPLISVSQKPLVGFGKNICVGPQPHCDASAFRQLLIGLKEAKTKFVLAAEADCLYPPEYFNFVPPVEDKAYRYGNIRILFKWYGKRSIGKYWKKELCEGAQICGREYWIMRLEWVLRRHKGWENKKPLAFVFDTKQQYSWTSENPVVSLKTTEGLRKLAGYIPGTGVDSVPYWGDANLLRKKLFED